VTPTFAGGVAFPNGMAVTSDNSTLILAESYGNKLSAFEIHPEGSLGNTRTWADLPGDHPDGICLDTDGTVWYGDVGNKHCVRVGQGGEVLQTVDLDRGCFACMLGGADGRTLFLIATDYSNPATLMSGRTGQVRFAMKGTHLTLVSLTEHHDEPTGQEIYHLNANEH